MALNIRNIDPELHRTLKAEAATLGVSLNQHCIDKLKFRSGYYGGINKDRYPADPLSDPNFMSVEKIMRAYQDPNNSPYGKGGTGKIYHRSSPDLLPEAKQAKIADPAKLVDSRESCISLAAIEAAHPSKDLLARELHNPKTCRVYRCGMCMSSKS